MDYNLYIALPEECIELVGIAEMKTSWGGENVSYNPRKFIFENTVQMFFVESEMISGVDEPVDKNQMMLKIINGLRELEWQANRQTEKLKSNNIMKLLQKICQLDKFSIYIFEDDEIIDQQIEYIMEKDILFLVSMALRWETPRNIKIFCK